MDYDEKTEERVINWWRLGLPVKKIVTELRGIGLKATASKVETLIQSYYTKNRAMALLDLTLIQDLDPMGLALVHQAAVVAHHNKPTDQ